MNILEHVDDLSTTKTELYFFLSVYTNSQCSLPLCRCCTLQGVIHFSISVKNATGIFYPIILTETDMEHKWPNTVITLGLNLATASGFISHLIKDGYANWELSITVWDIWYLTNTNIQHRAPFSFPELNPLLRLQEVRLYVKHYFKWCNCNHFNGNQNWALVIICSVCKDSHQLLYILKILQTLCCKVLFVSQHY